MGRTDMRIIIDREGEAVADMGDRMSQLRQAIVGHDYKWVKSIYDYLAAKANEYKDYSDDVYDIIICSDFVYDVMNSLKENNISVDDLLDKYDRLFNPDSPNYHDFSNTDNVIHDSGSYTGSGE